MARKTIGRGRRRPRADFYQTKRFRGLSVRGSKPRKSKFDVLRVVPLERQPRRRRKSSRRSKGR